MTTAMEISTRYEVAEEAGAFLKDGLAPEAFLEQLERAKLYGDAVEFLAYMLPAREAIWWGSQCLWHQYQGKPPAEADRALGFIVGWVLYPEDARRRECEAVSEKVGSDTAAGSLALAVFLSGGSVLPPGMPRVDPPPFMTAKLVARAVLLAALDGPPEQSQAAYRQFQRLGRDIAGGKNLWTGVRAAPVPEAKR